VVEATYDDGGARIRVQRRAGGRWRTIATSSGSGAPIITLARGKHTLRAAAEVGGDTVISAARTVKVVRTSRFSTGRRDDGRYRDPKRGSVRFSVAGGGRRISGFTADVPTLCGSAGAPNGFTPGVSTVTLPPVRIAPDGRFALQGTYRNATVRFTGRLRQRRLVGTRVAIAQTTCQGSIAVQARRVG
jgi:hypothetical protein